MTDPFPKPSPTMRIASLDDLAGTTWWITGASHGLGAAFVDLLAAAGTRLLLTGRDERALGAAVKRALEKGAMSAEFVVADLSRDGAGRAFARAAEARVGPPLGLINNAGIGLHEEFVATEWAEIEALLSTNFREVVHLSHWMAQSESGTSRYLLNVSSAIAFCPVPMMAAYAATKAGLVHFGLALSEELRTRGFTVTTLCPGMMKTKFFERAKISGGERFLKLGYFNTPEFVAERGMRALLSGMPILVPGVPNAVTTVLMRALPRRFVDAVTRWLML